MLRRVLFSVIAAVGICFSSIGQITGYELVPSVVHYETYQDPFANDMEVDLYGYITYDLYVTVTDSTDFISAIYAIPGETVIEFNFDCNLFQHGFAGMLVENNNSANWPLAPSMEFDSYVTIDKFASGDPGTIFYAAITPAEATIESQFEGDPLDGDFFDGGDLYIEDGSWFTTAINPNGEAGNDLRVNIARFTTCGGIVGCFGVQCFIGGDQSNDENVQICLDEMNPCVENFIDTDFVLTDEILCFGETATASVNPSGNGVVTYNVMTDEAEPQLVYSQVNDTSFANLDAGCYFIEVIDEIGCIDSTDVLCIIEPDELILGTELTSDELCEGELMGVLTNSAEGGVEPYVFSSDIDGLPDAADGETWENLACVSPWVVVTDDNGCQDSTQYTVSCPDSLSLDLTTIDITCFGYDNGEFQGTVTGGTGAITATWDCAGDETEISGTSPLDISVQDLPPCDYNLTVEDENGCQLIGLFTIDQPGELSTSIFVTDVSCFGESDGSIDVQTTGGTPEVTTECVPLGGGTPGDINLPAGEYLCTTTDGIGCMVWDTVTVNQPTHYTYQTLISDVSCAGGVDGILLFDTIQGGVGSAVLDIVGGPVGNIAALPDSGFVDLPADNYFVTFTDSGNGCIYEEGPFAIIEPDPITTEGVVTSITCYGFNDGMIDFTCAGGTGAVEITSALFIDTIPCPGTATDLPPGTHDFTFTDVNGCESLFSWTIEEPDSLTLDITGAIFIECGGNNDGGVEYITDGGTGDYNYQLDGVDVSIFDLVQLFAGEYELCAFDENQCQVCDTFTVSQNEPITITLDPIVNAGCTGMTNGSTNLFVSGGVGDLTLSFDPPDIDLNAMAEGLYTVFAIDSLGCVRDSTWAVGVEEESNIAFEIFTSPVSCWNTGDGTATAAVTGGNEPISITWSDPMNQEGPTAIGLIEGDYFVSIVDAVGCTFDTVATVQPNVGCFFISNALTPNGDGSNDTWLIGGLEYFPSATVSVLNRWGQVIYSSKGYTVPWNGEFNGQRVAVADYYYVISFVDGRDPITGTVTVKY